MQMVQLLDNKVQSLLQTQPVGSDGHLRPQLLMQSTDADVARITYKVHVRVGFGQICNQQHCLHLT